MDAEFEEKRYETGMNNELNTNRTIFAPGQMREHLIGIDAAIFSENIKLWELMRISKKIPSGQFLKPNLWDSYKIDPYELPKFKCNLFIQYKRPEYITRRHRKNEYHYWNRAYYRYNLDPNQQKVLCELERNSSNSLVIYACAAFWKNEEIRQIESNNQLVEKSNFVKPLSLNGHKKYTFIDSGKKGIGFSEPSYIDPIDLFKNINSMLETPNEFENNEKFIFALNDSIIKTVKKFDNNYQMAFKSLYDKTKNINNNDNNKLSRNIMNILIFNSVTNTNWFIGYD